MTDADREGIAAAAAALGTAWDTADAVAFAQVFTENADFVNIFAMHVVGREGIARQHHFIFDGIYRGTRNAFVLEDAEELADGIVLAHVSSNLVVPSGAMAGEVRTLASVVFVRDDGGWSIRSFHNTREQAPPV